MKNYLPSIFLVILSWGIANSQSCTPASKPFVQLGTNWEGGAAYVNLWHGATINNE